MTRRTAQERCRAPSHFPENARALLRWMGSGDFLDQVIDSLRKAGLDIPDDPTAAG